MSSKSYKPPTKSYKSKQGKLLPSVYRKKMQEKPSIKSSVKSSTITPLDCEDILQNHTFVIPTYDSSTDTYGSIEKNITKNIVDLIKGSVQNQTHSNNVCIYSQLEIESYVIFSVFTTKPHIPKKKLNALELSSNETAEFDSKDPIFKCFKSMLPVELSGHNILVFFWNNNNMSMPDGLSSLNFVTLKKHKSGGKYDSQRINKKNQTNKRSRKNQRTRKHRK
jgi:hypothetical protein